MDTKLGLEEMETYEKLIQKGIIKPAENLETEEVRGYSYVTLSHYFNIL